MFKNIKWLFFDIGSTIVDEHLAYEHRMRETAKMIGVKSKKKYKSM